MNTLRQKISNWLSPSYSVEILWESASKVKLKAVSKTRLDGCCFVCIMPSGKAHIYPTHKIVEIIVTRS